jgi:mono/diheme cytochrome c family protein
VILKSLTAVLIAALPFTPGGAAEASPVIGGLARQERVSPGLAGPVLISELGCTACHPSTREELAAKPGPDLSTVGARAHGAHLREFIANPAATKPGTTMPDSLGHLPAAERTAVADALAHYLVSLGSVTPTFAPPEPSAVERGRKLYHAVGCVACHSPEQPLTGSVPLGPLAGKYSVPSLARFLEDPLAVRPSGRMPDSRLDHFEAVDVASYLLREQASPPPVFRPDPQSAARGKALFTEHRCDACHTVGGPSPLLTLAALEQVRPDRGCLSDQPGPWPQYSLSDSQRAAVRAALPPPAAPLSDAGLLELSLTRLNCLACHQRGESGGVPANRNAHFTSRDENLGDQGRLPPPLTGVGAKLKRDWLRDVIVNGASARPYLNTRMPKFGAANAEPLARWFKQLDALPPAEFTRVGREEKPHEVGRELAGSKALNCIACHTFRGRSASPIRALDLTTMVERLEENWFHHYLAHPQRFSPLTIMPSFWPDGKSPLPDVLGGDSGRQRDALWQYLARGPEAREPQGLVLEPLVIPVLNEAVIIRRAFPGIGKRGIGVGYPGGINLAFDAGQMRLGSIWSGGFIEASGLWRGQGAGLARILGKDTTTFPPGPAFAVLDSAESAWPVADPSPRPSPHAFSGYTLDAQQRPTLRYSVAGLLVEDLFRERRDSGGNLFLERTLKFPSLPPAGTHFRVAADRVIEPRGTNEFAVGSNLRVRLPARPLIRSAGELLELLLPVTGELRIEYHLAVKP